MNLILLEKKDFIDKHRVRLDDARFEQIKTIHGSVSGDTVRVGELGGLMGEGVIESINDKQLELSVTLKQAPPEKLRLETRRYDVPKTSLLTTLPLLARTRFRLRRTRWDVTP